MRRPLRILGVLLAFLVAAALLVPRLISLDSYRVEIAAKIAEATGRAVRIDGPVRLSILPRLSLDVTGIGLGNLPGRSPAEMASVETGHLVLKLLPLFSREIAVDRFVLDRPVIDLEVDRQGKENWSFSAPAKNDETGSGGSGFRLSQLRLENVRLVDGTLRYVDRRSGTARSATAIDLAISLAGLDAPLDASGDFVFQEKKIAVQANVARPRDCLDGKSTPLRARVASDVVKLDFDGEVACRADLDMRGAADLDVPSAKALAAWAGTETPLLGAVRLRGKVDVADRKASFREASLAIDDLRASGDVGFDFRGVRRRLDGRLTVQDLDLRPYLASGEKQARETAPNPAPSWSETPIDLSSLRAADASIDITLASLRLRRLELGATALNANLVEGRLTLDLSGIALYSGTGKATATLDGSRDDSVGVDVEAHAAGIQVEPLLRNAAGSDRVAGAATLDLVAHSRGRSERELIGGLAGNGALQVKDGVIRGINLGAMVMRVATAFQAGDPAAKTEFSEMGGTFTIAGGVVRNSDMSMTSPLLVVAGAGSVDFNTRRMDYRITPKVVAPVLSQLTGGVGVAVPVLIRGPWDNLRYEPDLVGLVTQVPMAVLGTAEDITKIPGDIWRGATGRPSAARPKQDAAEPKSSNPLKRLFGR